MVELIDQLTDLLLSAQYVIAFTGAGISTESGIPDFRSQREGLWERIDPDLLSARTLKADPALFFRYFVELTKSLTGKEPNPGHLALAELCHRRVVRSVITQNIDGLHQQAGSPKVLEVHGNLRGCRCTACGREYPYELLRAKLEKTLVPLAECCQAVLRPNVVLFGDQLTADFQAAEQEAFRSDFALVIGTSLTVYPAAKIPLTVGRFAIINREETDFDSQALLNIPGSIGQVMAALVESVRRWQAGR